MEKKNWLTKIFPGDIRCASTMNAQKKSVACIIRPDCWCLRTIVLMDQPSIRLLGRAGRANYSVRRSWWRKHGASRTSMITFLGGKEPRPVIVSVHTSVAAVDLITAIIMVRTNSRQSSRKRSWRSSPHSAAQRASLSTTTWRIGTSGISTLYELFNH